MQFFASAVTTLQTLVVALGAGLAVWGVVNLLEGYGSDNAAPSATTRVCRVVTAEAKNCISPPFLRGQRSGHEKSRHFWRQLILWPP